MSVSQTLAMLNICPTSVTFLRLHNLKAAPEGTMQLRRLIKSSNESLEPWVWSTLPLGVIVPRKAWV